MSTAPLDPPTEHDELATRLAYCEEQYRRVDLATDAVGALRDAYATLGKALGAAEDALTDCRSYDPDTAILTEDGPLLAATLGVPSRTKEVVTYDPERFLDTNVLLNAMHTGLDALAETILKDAQEARRLLEDKDSVA